MQQTRALTGIRGFAGIWVMLFHFYDTQLNTNLALTFVGRSYLYVDLFFILSGFVMAMSYRSLFVDGVTGHAFVGFLGRRVARIFPLYIVVTLLIAALVFTGHSARVPRDQFVPILLTNLLLVQSWFGIRSFDFTAWSVSVEWGVYVVFPLLLLLTLRDRALPAIAVAFLSIGLICFVFLAPGFGPLDGVRATATADPVVLAAAPMLRGFSEFTLGLLLFRVARSAIGRRWASSSWTGIAVAVPCIVLFTRPANGVADIVLVLLFAALILAVSQDQGPAGRFFASTPIYKLGAWSYATYLLHPGVMGVLRKLETVFARHHVPAGDLLAKLASVALVIVLSALTYNLIENPARRFIQNRLPRKRIVPAPAPVGGLSGDIAT